MHRKLCEGLRGTVHSHTTEDNDDLTGDVPLTTWLEIQKPRASGVGAINLERVAACIRSSGGHYDARSNAFKHWKNRLIALFEGFGLR